MSTRDLEVEERADLLKMVADRYGDYDYVLGGWKEYYIKDGELVVWFESRHGKEVREGRWRLEFLGGEVRAHDRSRR